MMSKADMRLPFILKKISKAVRLHWFIGVSLAILLISFWLRWSGVDWQLPDPRYGDEEAMIQMTHSVSLKNGLVIGGKLGFWYGPAYNYLSAAVFYVFDNVVVAARLFPSTELIPSWTHFFVGRTLSVLMSLGAIAVLMFLFKNVVGKFAALLAGLLLALNEIDVYIATIAKSDTMAVFLSALALYLAFKLMTSKGRVLYFVAGAVYGAAVASKLFVIGFFVPLVLGHILGQTGNNLISRLRNSVKDRRWLILPVAALMGYVIANPQSLLALGTFVKEVPGKLIFGYMGESNREYKTITELFGRMKAIYSNLLAPTHSKSLLALAIACIGSIVLLVRRFKFGLMLVVAFISVNLFILPATAAYGSTHHYMAVVPICVLLIGSALSALWSLLIRIRITSFRLLSCGVLIVAVAFILSGMWSKSKHVVNSQTGKGVLSRSADFRKWMIDNIPPGSRIAYDRYGTDLLTGYFEIVTRPGFDQGLEYYSKNFDYVIMSEDRINDYKVNEELLKRKPLAAFEAEGVRYMPHLALYKMERSESLPPRIRNFYTETLPRKKGMESTLSDPSFENEELTESWGVKFFYAYQEEKPVDWWDGKEECPPHHFIEKATDTLSDGFNSLHVRVAEEEPTIKLGKQRANLLSEENSGFEAESDWQGFGSHSVSREADGNAYDGRYALKVVSSGKGNEWSVISLTHSHYDYNNGQANVLTFFAKSASGKKTLRVRSGDGTWGTFSLSKKYRKYKIVGSTKVLDNMLFILEGAGIFYLDSVEFKAFAKDKKMQIGQVIPYEFLDGLRNFSIDYYVKCDPSQEKPSGTVNLHFIAESLGGQYLNHETHVLYDSERARNPLCNEWQTFSRNIKADFDKPFVKWRDIEFMIFYIEVINREFGNLEIYFDNIQTAEKREKMGTVPIFSPFSPFSFLFDLCL